MANSSSLINKADKLLARFNVTDRAVYKRIVVRQGGDRLLGRPGAVDVNDVLLSPPPVVKYWGFTARKNNYYESVLVEDGVGQLGDVILDPISVNAISRAELQNPDITFVFKDSFGEEEMTVVAMQPTAFQGVDVLFTILLRSKKR